LIIHFRDDETEALFTTGHSRRFSSIAKIAKRKLDALNAAATLNDLHVPPGNRLEALKGDR
jgi:toxin HigB-1